LPARGPAALPYYFATPRGRALPPSTREAFFFYATRGGSEGVADAADRVLAAGDVPAWRALLEMLTGSTARLDRAHAVAGLTSPISEVRGETAWYLAKVSATEPLEYAGEVRTLLSSAQAGVATGDGDLDFGRELLGRVLGRPPAESAAWITRLQLPARSQVDRRFPKEIFKHLTPGERDAVEDHDRRRSYDRKRLRRGPDLGEATVQPPSYRLAGGYPKGVVTDVLALTGCRGNTGDSGMANISYREDGRPMHVQFAIMPRARGCAAALEALLVTALAGEGYVARPSAREGVVVFLDAGLAARLDEEGVEDGRDPWEGDGVLVMGKATNRHQPVYVEQEKRRGVQGSVIVEVRLTTGGEVDRARVITGTGTTLDLAAIYSATRWRFSPTTLDGKPTAASGTLSFNFRQR
jgi:TonB family protein